MTTMMVTARRRRAAARRGSSNSVRLVVRSVGGPRRVELRGLAGVVVIVEHLGELPDVHDRRRELGERVEERDDLVACECRGKELGGAAAS